MWKSFPFVRQHDAMECGVACLTMILRWFGRSCSLASVAEMCPPSSQGVSLLGLDRTARDLGFDTAVGKVTIDELRAAPMPVILHWNQRHFVVLYRVSHGGSRFHISDPAKGHIVCSVADMERHWLSTCSEGVRKGIALFLQPGENFDTLSANAADGGEQRSWSFLAGYLRQYRRQFGYVIAALAAGSLLQLILPFLTQAIVDRGINGRDLNIIWLILLGELMIVFGRTLSDIIRRRLLLHVSMRINISLISDFFMKLLRLPMAYFDTKLSGDLLQRMQDHGRVQQFLTGQVLTLAFSVISFCIYAVVMLIYNKLIFLVFLLFSIVYGLWIVSFLRKRKVLDYELFEQQSRNQNLSYRFVTTMQEIKLQDCENRRTEEWQQTQLQLFDIQMRSLKMQQSQEAGSVFISEIKNVTITVMAASAVISGDMTLGAMMAMQFIIGQLNAPVEQLMAFVYAIQDVKISLERINEVHTRPDEEDGCGGRQEFSLGQSGGIAVRNVDFRYIKFSPVPTLSDINVRIPEGKVTAVVGASGSGKTTLLKLILGYYKPERGLIEVEGLQLDDYSLKWWRRQCGVVNQDGILFSESIARNIAVSDGKVDNERLEQAARIACIHDYVQSLPLRYDTRIGPDGMGLSQGQKQRVLIARAVYKNPRFIILDEATNSLDAENERQIVDNLSKFYRGRTVLIVAHRLSTVKNADNIVVLSAGRVVEQGTHTQLVDLKGVYYNLVSNQLELGL